MQNNAHLFDSVAFGQAVKAARKAKAWPLDVLASEIGVATATLSRVERAIMTPDLSTYVTICRWLGVSTERFVKP